MKKTCLFLAAILLAGAANLRAEWKKSLNVALTLSQSKSKTGATGNLYSKENLSYGLLLNGELTRDKAAYNWKNTLKLEYSNVKNKDETDPASTGEWSESKDKLTVDSVRRWKMTKALNPYAAVNFQTAVRDSNFPNEWKAFRPVQIRESAGMGFPLISGENHEFIARGGSYFQHYANSPASKGLYEKSSGMELVLDYKNDKRENISFSLKAGFYSSFTATRDPWNTDTKSKKIRFEWENTLISAVSRHISLNITLNINNIDVTSSHANWEWEEKLNAALNWKIF